MFRVSWAIVDMTRKDTTKNPEPDRVAFRAPTDSEVAHFMLSGDYTWRVTSGNIKRGQRGVVRSGGMFRLCHDRRELLERLD